MYFYFSEYCPASSAFFLCFLTFQSRDEKTVHRSTRPSRVHSCSKVAKEALSHFNQHFLKAVWQHERTLQSNSPRWPLTSVSTMFGWLFTFKHQVNRKVWLSKEVNRRWLQRTSLEWLECLLFFPPTFFHPFIVVLWVFPVRLIYPYSV